MPSTATDATVAAYIVDLASAGADCRSALGWVKAWSERMTQPAK